jgi:hypothetical protein
MNEKLILAGAGIVAGAAVAYVVASGGVKNAARNLGIGTASAVDGAASGVVVGAGSVLGLPDTDAAKCQAAMESGNYMDASLFCPAPTFLKFVANGGKVPT